MLFALAIVLSFVESLIAPIFALPPGVKLGLGNIVVMYCMVYLGFSSAVQVSALKGFFSFLTRGFTAGVLSFTGGIFSVVIMFLLRKAFRDKINYYTLSVFGALFHNIGQLLVAAGVLKSWAVMAYLPYLLLSGVITGFFTGWCAQFLVQRLDNIRH